MENKEQRKKDQQSGRRASSGHRESKKEHARNGHITLLSSIGAVGLFAAGVFVFKGGRFHYVFALVSFFISLVAFIAASYVSYLPVFPRLAKWKQKRIKRIFSAILALAVFISAFLLWMILSVLPPAGWPEPSPLTGLLVPGDDPTPPFPPSCRYQSFPPGSWGIFYGNSLAYQSSQSVTVVEVSGKPLLAVNRTPDGLSLSAEIYSSDGRIVASIKDNDFTINQNNYFRRERPDKSTLVIYDQYNVPVFNVRYLNPLAVRVTGMFQYANQTVIINDTSVKTHGITFTGACQYEVRTIISN